MEVKDTFVLTGYASHGPFSALYVKLEGVSCGHRYQEEVGSEVYFPLTLYDHVALRALDEAEHARKVAEEAERFPGWDDAEVMGCILCGVPIPSRQNANEDGTGKYCDEHKGL